MPTSRRSKAGWRWVVVTLSGLATAGFLGSIVNGPPPAHASPPPTPAVVQQAPTLDQMLSQDQVIVDDGSADQSGGGDLAASGQMPQPRFVTRGS